jgi:hypothetical protein
MDKGYTDVNSALSLTFRKKALKNIEINEHSLSYAKDVLEATIQSMNDDYLALDINREMSGVFLYAGSTSSLPHALPKASAYSADENLHGLGAQCNSYMQA